MLMQQDWTLAARLLCAHPPLAWRVLSAGRLALRCPAVVWVAPSLPPETTSSSALRSDL